MDITPDGNVVIVAGKNAQGKTSVLDSIWFALGGKGAASDTPHPVRDGEAKATIRLDLGGVDLGGLIVTRTFTDTGGSSLKVTSADGYTTHTSPQKLLDSFMGRLSFDPLAFTNQSDKEQLATLLGLVDLEFDPAELDAARKALFEERTVVGRELKSVKARYEAAERVPVGTPKEEVSAADLLAQIQAATAHEAANAEVTRTWTAACERASDLESRVTAMSLELAKLQGELDEARGECEALGDQVDNLEPAPDVSGLSSQMEEIDDLNRRVRAGRLRAELKANLDEVEARHSDLTGRLELIDATKADGLAAANMPIEGLAFDEEGVTYNDMPFKQCSAAEQLRVSLAMGMAMNPTIRVILIRDGSLLDSANMALVTEMAEAHDFQVWVERVDETGEVGVYLEDGSVVEPPA